MTCTEDLVPACGFHGGCLYLRDLSKLERLIGCDPTANFYERTADRCAREGCWALLVHLRELASPSRPYLPRFPLKASRPARAAKPSRTKARSAEVIPLLRPDVADVVSDEDDNFVERHALKMGALDPVEPLGYMYDYWRWLNSMTSCQLSNIDTMHLMRARIIGNLHVVDVQSADPNDFRFEMFGFAVPVERYEKPAAFSTAIYADAVLCDYNTVRLSAAPRLQRVRARLGGVYHNYVRLILPLFDEHRRVSRLLVGVRLEPGDGTLMDRRRKDAP